jgi:hypothetical protein
MAGEIRRGSRLTFCDVTIILYIIFFDCKCRSNFTELAAPNIHCVQSVLNPDVQVLTILFGKSLLRAF